MPPTLGANTLVTAAKNATGIRVDPLEAYNFHIEIEGLVVGSFSAVSGIESKTEVESFYEGGVNEFAYQLPKTTSFSHLILKAGISYFGVLANWYEDVQNGNIKRKNGSIYMLNNSRTLPKLWWDFHDAWPIQWSGPELQADNTTVAMESITLAHHGIKRSALSKAASAISGAASIGAQAASKVF